MGMLKRLYRYLLHNIDASTGLTREEFYNLEVKKEIKYAKKKK